MSLIRQVWLLLALTLSLAFVGAFGITVQSARHNLETQLSLKNNDTAHSLALTVSNDFFDGAKACRNSMKERSYAMFVVPCGFVHC